MHTVYMFYYIILYFNLTIVILFKRGIHSPPIEDRGLLPNSNKSLFLINNAIHIS